MIERSFDYRRIKKLMKFDMLVTREIYYLIDTEDGEDLGVWYMHDWDGDAQLHVSMGPKCRGKRAKQSALEVFDWIFKNTPYRRIYGMVPNEYKESGRLAVACGMEFVREEDDQRLYRLDHG